MKKRKDISAFKQGYMKKETELKEEIEWYHKRCENYLKEIVDLKKSHKLELKQEILINSQYGFEQGKQEGYQSAIQKAIEMIEKFGQYPCGFINSSDNLCDKIDKKELTQKLLQLLSQLNSQQDSSISCC